jgi:hypothetical protein
MFTSLVVPPYAFQSLPSSLRLATFVAGCTSVTEQVTSLSFSDIDSQPWFQHKPHIVVSLLYRPRNAPSMYTSSRAWDKHRPHRNPPKKALLKRSNFGSSVSPSCPRTTERIFNTTCTSDFATLQQEQVGWPNGKALDYESRDCRFDPCVDQ